MLKFNLGCGDKCAQGWVNLDASWNLFLSRFPVLRGFCKALSGGKSPAGPANVGYWDARKPLPCKDGAADVIYASHLLEHLSRPKALALLKECRRALKPGGICRMVVPDLKGAAEQYLAKKISADGFMEFLNFKERHLRSEPAPKKIYYWMQGDPHHHKWMYDEVSLARLFQEAGFTAPQAKAWRESHIEDIALVEPEGRMGPGVGIAVEAHA